MSEMKLFNTLTRSKEEFKPLNPPVVGLYTCGPTVYNYQHVGNYRTYLFEDLLTRTLRYLGFSVRHVMNITDVGHLVSQADEGDDKIEVSAAREGKTAWQIAQFYTDAFLTDCRELNIQAPDVLCRATGHILEQIELIQRLEKKGLIYAISDGLYFDTSKFLGYGKLAGADNHSGGPVVSRVESNPEKRSPADFAVWKFAPRAKQRQMIWESPWGLGFPGWHIECSAMAIKYLGESFDIHCGGVDHIPIHHTNEIAQSEGATGKPFVRFWLHGEFLLMGSAKMAKSAGGFVTLSDLKEKGFHPLDYRYHCFGAHYRKQLDFTWASLEAAKTARRRLKEIALELKAHPAQPACADHAGLFKNALADDLNVPAALAGLWNSLKVPGIPPGSRLSMLEMAERVFALGLFDEAEDSVSAEISALLDQRQRARRDRDFALSDKLRLELSAKGVIVEDTRQGQKWRKT